MRAMAVTDPLTGCYNRRFLDEIARHELEQHRRYKLPLSLLFIDIDRFKAINDARGHETGDRVLRTIGEVLHEHPRGRLRVPLGRRRIPGDDLRRRAPARAKADEIRLRFLSRDRGAAAGGSTSASAACRSAGCDDLDPLIEEADKDMYRRKRGAQERVDLRRTSAVQQILRPQRRQRASTPLHRAATAAGSSPRFTRSKLSREPSRRSWSPA